MKTSLCSVAFSVAGFVGDWNHCDQVADYLATAVSADQPESFRYSNLLSRIINEVLESIHLSNRPASMIEVEISVERPFVSITMHLDTSDRIVDLYSNIADQVANENAEKLYQQSFLLKTRCVELGVLGIVTHYSAQIVVRSPNPGRTAIELSVAPDRFLEVTQCLPISIANQ